MEQLLELNLHRIMLELLNRRVIMKTLLRTTLEILGVWIVLLRLLIIIGINIRTLITTMCSLTILNRITRTLRMLVL
nr:MAG TPA: hypothetical protein [Caudoviricetes sp.]